MIKNKNKKRYYLLLIISLLINISCFNKEETQPTTLKMINQPIYELFIDARGCYFEILVNDVPIYFHYNIGATAFRLPINNFIPKSGEQTISLRMVSVVEGKAFPQGTEVSLTVDEYPKGEPRERKTVFTFKTNPFDEKNSGLFLVENRFSANVPYTLTNWKQGIDLTKEDEKILKKEIEKKYIEYTDAFKNEDLSKYKALTNLRQQDAFESLYYLEEQKRQEENSYVNIEENSKVKLYPLENYKLVFYGNGGLVGLQKPKEAPGIFIDNEDEEYAFMEYILFYRKSNNSLLQIIF